MKHVRGPKQSECDRWLIAYLTKHGPQPSLKIREAGQRAGYTETMLRESKVALGIRHGTSTKKYAFVWLLPEQFNRDITRDGRGFRVEHMFDREARQKLTDKYRRLLLRTVRPAA